jgi:hypothetical protein
MNEYSAINLLEASQFSEHKQNIYYGYMIVKPEYQGASSSISCSSIIQACSVNSWMSSKEPVSWRSRLVAPFLLLLWYRCRPCS